GGMFQFLKRHIIKAISSLRRGGRRCHFGVVFQVGGESERTFFAFFTTPPKGHKQTYKRLSRRTKPDLPKPHDRRRVSELAGRRTAECRVRRPAFSLWRTLNVDHGASKMPPRSYD